uniref:Secreted protein n=1 Tax=Streptomyces sp. NBC_00049 TaxID=2903617 RepID=A0AAU2JNP3_9ACTN
MKLTKVAAVVAGSLAALGASAPAFAADAPAAMPPMSLTGGVTETLNEIGPVSESLPQTVGNGLAEQGDTVNKAVDAAQQVNKVRNDLPGTVLGLANGATQTTPMLGGVKLNGGQG